MHAPSRGRPTVGEVNLGTALSLKVTTHMLLQDTNIVSGFLISPLPNILFLRAALARTNRKLFLLLVDFTSSISTISSAPNTAQWNLNLTQSSPEKKNSHIHIATEINFFLNTGLYSPVLQWRALSR